MKIRVRTNSHLGQMFCYEPAVQIFVGKLLPNPEWVGKDCITLSTDDPFLPMRIIRRKDIVGKIIPKAKTQPTGRRWKVKSSKGDQFYRVTFDGRFWGCNCVGFSFHQDCRHVRLVKAKISK